MQIRFFSGLFGFFLITLFIVSCESGNRLDVSDSQIVKGMPDPVIIDSERIIIPMADYVNDPFKIDSVTTDGPFAMEIDNSNILLYGRPQNTLYTMTFWSGSFGESILLKTVKKSLHSFLYQKKAKGVKIIGDFNDWNAEKGIMKRNRSVFSNYVLLSPGRYEYRFVVDGKEMTDPLNKDSVKSESGKWNSVLTISDRTIDHLARMELTSFSGNSIRLEISKKPHRVCVFWQNTQLPDEYITVEFPAIEVIVPTNAMELEQSVLKVWVEDQKKVSNHLEVPLYFGKAGDLNK